VTVSLLDILGTFLRKVVIDGEGHQQLVAYFAFLTVLVVGIELVLSGAFGSGGG
jgi:phosphonate transport system permease protein